MTVLSLDTGTWTPGCGEREPSSDPGDGHLRGKSTVRTDELCAQIALHKQVLPPLGSSQTRARSHP